MIQQLSGGMPFGQQPTDLLRDDEGFDREVACGFLVGLGIEEIKTASHSPRQNSSLGKFISILLKVPTLNTGIERRR